MKEEILTCDFLTNILSFQKSSLAEIWDLKREIELSFLYDQSKLQDSYSFRLQRRAFLTAQYLVDDKGKLDVNKLDQVISLLEKEGNIFYPQGHFDSIACLHMQVVLKKLQTDKSFYQFFHKFQGPLCHAWADEIVLASVGCFDSMTPSESQIKRAVLSACLTCLRQNVGSCFATAPAILIQQEQIDKLLSDLYELLMTGKLKKTVQGVEISVPLSPSTGGGDLYRKVFFTQDLCLSPGLHEAFKDLIPKGETLSSFLLPMFKENKSMQVIEIIHEALLSHFDLTEEDLIRYKEGQRSFLKSQEFLSGVKKGSSSQKSLLSEKMLAQEKKAQAAFKASVSHPLLKAWEFTLASFSESKMEFSRWNLYSGLGLHHEEKGGIGEVIYLALQEHLEVDEKKMKEYDIEYQIAFDQVRATELLLKNASSQSEARRLQTELASRFYHMRACLEMRDTLHANASEYSSFFSSLLKEYDIKFSEYFQEIFDADLHGISSDDYEDSPAGFRLVYKHGRSNAFLWTMIDDAEEYIDALVDFFLLVEPQIAALFSWELAPKILTEITTLIVAHLRTSEFLESAMKRSVKVHKERGETGKPWAYLSGGSMSILLQTYYKRESSVTEESKKIESPTDLLIFLLDTLKTIPLSSENKKLLMASPSHAFTLIPSLELFQAGWKDDLFTYTWVRDKVVLPRKKFYEAMSLSPSEQNFLLEELAKKLPLEASHLLHKVPCFQETPLHVFRNSILDVFSHFSLEDFIDSFLYEMMPLVSGFNWKQLVTNLLADLNPSHLESHLEGYPDDFCEIMSAKRVKDLSKAFYLLSEQSISFSFDLHAAVSKKAEELGLAPPAPLLFADTNWSQFYFGFIVNPGTGLLDLWRLEPSSASGYPMSSWKKYLREENESLWNIYTRPFEYS